MANLVRIHADEAPLDMILKPFSSIGHDWMLITAGSGIAREEWNTMTASWGGFGVFWNKKTVTCVVRPTRHTFAFLEREPLVTFSFFDPAMKKALHVCGSTSGATTDKASAAGLSPILLETGAVGFNESKLSLVCRKIYRQDIDPVGFIDADLAKNYPEKDYHRMYICEIVSVYQREKN